MSDQPEQEQIDQLLDSLAADRDGGHNPELALTDKVRICMPGKTDDEIKAFISEQNLLANYLTLYIERTLNCMASVYLADIHAENELANLKKLQTGSGDLMAVISRQNSGEQVGLLFDRIAGQALIDGHFGRQTKERFVAGFGRFDLYALSVIVQRLLPALNVARNISEDRYHDCRVLQAEYAPVSDTPAIVLEFALLIDEEQGILRVCLPAVEAAGKTTAGAMQGGPAHTGRFFDLRHLEQMEQLGIWGHSIPAVPVQASDAPGEFPTFSTLAAWAQADERNFALLAQVLEELRIRVIDRVLSCFGPELAYSLYKTLPHSTRTDVFRGICKGGGVNSDGIGILCQYLRELFTRGETDRLFRKCSSGLGRKMFHLLESVGQKDMLEAFGEDDPELAEEMAKWLSEEDKSSRDN